MAHVLVHTGVIDDLAARPGALPKEIAEALREDRVYARFGAVFPDLPWFDLEPGVLLDRIRGRSAAPPPFATLFHNGAPIAVGLRIAELVAGAGFVGRMAGLAFVAGYFSHVAVDRALSPPVQDLARRISLDGERPLDAVRRIERLQALIFMRRREGRVIPGWSGITEHLRVLKRSGFPYRGVGRGLHLLVQTACAETLGPAPSKAELDRWVRGLYLYADLLGSPLGAPLGPGAELEELRRKIYHGDDFDFEPLYRAAVERAGHHVEEAYAYLMEGDFGRGAREAFFLTVPEGTIV